MHLGDSIRKGTKWIATGSIAGRLSAFAFGVILARLLVPEDFGMLVTIQIFTGMAGLVAGGGMGQALVQSKEISERHFHVVFTLQLIICSVIYIVFFVLSPWFAALYENPLYEDLLRISALNFLLRPFANTLSSRLHREMRFKETAIISFLSITAASTLSVILAILGYGVWSLIIGGLFSSIARNMMLRFVVRKKTRIYFNKEIAKSLGTYGFKVQTNNIVMFFKSQTTNFVLSLYTTPWAIGIFNKADSLATLPRATIASSAYKTVFRALSANQENLDLSRYIYFRTITLVSVYTMPFYIGLWWIADPFIEFVYGKNWSEASTPLQILSLTGLLLLGGSSGAVLDAQNRVGREILLNIVTYPILIGCILIGLKWGIEGVAWGIVINHLIANILIAYLANKCLRSTLASYIKALFPAYLLNIILFITLFTVDLFWLSGIKYTQPGTYIFSMASIGAISYTLMFLYTPPETLKTEADRWNKKIHSSVKKLQKCLRKSTS